MNNIISNAGLGTKICGTFAGSWIESTGNQKLSPISPVNGQVTATFSATDLSAVNTVVSHSNKVFASWRSVPAPIRGEIVRQIGDSLRSKKEDLAKLITLECGKILSEARGEVQEAIDIADFAVGLSRQLYGKSMHSERPQHRMYEQWHPLGAVGVITAFNFPLAVWAWNAFIAAVCGDTVIWKPSEKTPLIAIATIKLCEEILSKNGHSGVFSLVNGGAEIGSALAADSRIPLISATGSVAMGRKVSEVVAKRLGRSLLELGGNNALIVCEDANLELAKRAILFGAVGTAGQRCTTTRRLLVHKSCRANLLEQLVAGYASVKIGDPFLDGVLMGPVMGDAGLAAYKSGIELATKSGGKIVCGNEFLENMPSKYYVRPTILDVKSDNPILKEEFFAPILSIVEFSSIDEAIKLQNDVPQGLSSAIFTNSVQTAEQFLAATGSDCGIANVNIGTSGAEIGGAFGGEKDTGGGREAGSDSWKAYMRRQTNTINWGDKLPLAQGVRFD
jgi:aldehyde dehydrogenase (NAD+)